MADIAIVGAGITGPATAFTLARNGHSVHVHEQRPESGLYSAGVLGITEGNWHRLIQAGVPVQRYQLRNRFRLYGETTSHPLTSPFRYIAWIDLHSALTETAREYGARFRFGRRVDPAALFAEYVIDAGGIFSASRRLTSTYTGFAIYRGLSHLDSADDFVVYDLPIDGYYTQSHTAYGAVWALFVPRDEPQHHRTVITTTPPAETDSLPAEFAEVIRATDAPLVSYMSDWDVPTIAHDESYTRFTRGDANGPVRPVTTSGANLAVMAGLAAEVMITGTRTQLDRAERSLLRRRRYDMRLGQMLQNPEIGGASTDALYTLHHNTLFLAGER
jgi:2-polyprenyl-6-methoxyphenol hydroxylase-like FAD-dependent oxidoreductase